MTRTGMGLAIFTLLVLQMHRPVAAQIDHRVQQQASGNDGRALDKNPQVGSGGYNRPRSSAFDGGLGARSIITGNVTGLGRFHQDSPIIQSNQFRVGLPSAGLSGFTASSVGLQQVISGRALRPTYYLGTQETIPDAGFLRSGLNRPGSSLLITPLTRTPGPLSRIPSRRQPIVPDSIDRRLDVNPTNLSPGVTTARIKAATSSIFDRQPQSPFKRAAGSSIFGIPDQNAPAPSIPSLADSDIEPWMSNRRVSEPRSRFTVSEEESSPDAHRAPSPLDRPSGLAGPRTYRQTGSETPVQNQPTAMPTPGLREPITPRLGEDRFSDLFQAVAEAQRRGNRSIGFLGSKPDAIGRVDQPRRSTRDNNQKLADLAATVRWSDHLLRDPLKSFVGRNQNRLNQFLADAESALHAGRYYEADRQYQLALTIDPTNPLPMLGRGHALIAAGDYLSAALWIERGIQRFPQITAFRLDLPSIVGRHDVFDIRRADLEKRLAIGEYHRLRFLLGYIELYSGLEVQALRDLERAAKQAPPNSIIALFPDLVLGRRELPPLPEDIPRGN